jgi:hypothetical protein
MKRGNRGDDFEHCREPMPSSTLEAHRPAHSDLARVDIVRQSAGLGGAGDPQRSFEQPSEPLFLALRAAIPDCPPARRTGTTHWHDPWDRHRRIVAWY